MGHLQSIHKSLSMYNALKHHMRLRLVRLVSIYEDLGFRKDLHCAKG